MTAWLIKPEVAAWISAWGLLVGALSLIAAVIGFIITWLQIASAKQMAEAARDAAQQARTRVGTYDVVAELAASLDRIKEVQRQLRLGAWQPVVDTYLQTRESLVRVSKLPSTLSEEQRESVAKILADIVSFCNKVETDLVQDSSTVDIARALRMARSHADEITALSIVVKGA